jgi:hypothetical protein
VIPNKRKFQIKGFRGNWNGIERVIWNLLSRSPVSREFKAGFTTNIPLYIGFRYRRTPDSEVLVELCQLSNAGEYSYDTRNLCWQIGTQCSYLMQLFANKSVFTGLP